MEKLKIKEAAEILYRAEKELAPVEPLTEQYPGITIDEAYRVQLANVEKKVGTGAVIVGKKIGLTSRAMQKMLGVPEPDYGHLLDNMIGEEEEAVKLSSLLQPKVEAEIAFVLKEDLKGPGVTLTRVLQATEGVIPAIEIIDSRVRDWKIKIEDTVADNASSAMVILGRNLVPVKDINLKYTGLVLEKNGRIIDTAAGAAVLGHPALAVAWLANKLAEYDITLKAGEIILSGSLTSAYEVTGSDMFTATFDRLGQVKVMFEEQ